MELKIINQNNSILNHFLLSIRDIEKQKSKAVFRKNLERCGEILAYEISKDLSYKTEKVTTPLAESQVNILQDPVVLACILRASLPFYQGFLNYYEEAESGFIGAARVNTEGNEFEIKSDYFAFPILSHQTLIVIDPMLATGKSLVATVNHMIKEQKPKRLILASLIATPEGIDFVKENLNMDFSLYTAALDKELNDKYYIVPGLGDAGDLAFGLKQ